MKYKFLMVFLFLLGWAFSVGNAQEAEPAAPAAAEDSLATDSIPPPRPVSNLQARDKENDHGHAIVLTWTPSPDDGTGAKTVMMYEIFRWVPYFMDTLSAIRDSVSQMREYIADIEAFLPRAEKRLKRYQKKEGEGFADSVTFYADTIASCERLLPQYRRNLKMWLKKREEAIEHIPVAHKSYPNQGEWRKIGTALSGATEYVDIGSKEKSSGDYLADYTDYYYRVDAVTSDPAIRASSEIAGPVQSYGQLYHTGRTPVLVAVLIFAVLTIYFISKARRGIDLYVRPLPGIQAVDDAIGRATEMGKPILYVLGLGSAADIATIASFTILGRVARKVAEYQTKLIVPCYDPIVMTVAQETVKAAYSDAGRPDDYDEDIVYFVTQSQFAYVAAVNGTMLRERPATNIYMGIFYAESLILAETGAVAGSIQISGTDQIAQIPFFIVACDYTLIGEELYAASAYLGREPLLLGSLKAQDYAKALVIILSIIGFLAANVGWHSLVKLFKVVD